jgi:hypothetical protein
VNRLRARLPMLLVVAAAVLTAGYVREHRDATVTDVVVDAQSRSLSGGGSDDDLVRAIVTTPLLATRLHAAGTIPASAADIRSIVRVDAPLPDLRVRVSTVGAGYAEQVARSWIRAANDVYRALVTAPKPARDRLLRSVLAGAGAPSLRRAQASLRSERRVASTAGKPAATAPDLVVAAPAASVTNRIPRAWSLVVWLAVAVGAGSLVLLVPRRRVAA